MNAALVGDGRLYAVLKQLDEDLAAQQRAGGCPQCRGALHSAHYPRKPRGLPHGFHGEHERRLSLCCAREGCRSRATPTSLRFLGRKVYLAAVVVLISALRCGPTPARLRYLEELVGVSRRTILRWRRWWTETLVDTPFWRGAAPTVMPPVCMAELPAALLERFAGSSLDRLLALLRWLSPISTGSATVRAR